MKIGIFAGTFDPIHAGHIEFAKTAITAAGLERVVIVAEKNPYRKKPHASWDHRQAMIERATEGLENIDHDYQFAANLAHQHTMQNMLAVAAKHFGAENEVWFLVGSDVYEHIHQWKDLVKNSEYGGFVVALRDDHTEAWLKEKKQLAVQNGITAPVIVIDSRHPHVSSTAIRDSARQGKSSAELLPAVQEYIVTHLLYV